MSGIKKGHRIRLEIASSGFPKYNCNPNTGAPLGKSAEMRTAEQTVYHDRDHPSYLQLPIVPAKP
jgi:predicted acyl esterase